MVVEYPEAPQLPTVEEIFLKPPSSPTLNIVHPKMKGNTFINNIEKIQNNSVEKEHIDFINQSESSSSLKEIWNDI